MEQNRLYLKSCPKQLERLLSELGFQMASNDSWNSEKYRLKINLHRLSDPDTPFMIRIENSGMNGNNKEFERIEKIIRERYEV